MNLQTETSSTPLMRVLYVTFLIAAALFIVSLFLRGRYPQPDAILPDLQTEPVQIESGESPFQEKVKDKTYDITPRYAYELRGMVVSYHYSGSFIDISHARWGDYINIMDICVIWGGNVASDVYRKIKFSSGDFMCNYFTRDREAFLEFDTARISNSHLLATDRRVARAITSARRGDQIYLGGYLADYSVDGKPPRRTSTTREDTGNGACEVVYVTDFQVLQRANAFWNLVHTVTKYLILICAVLIVVAFFVL